MSSMTSQTNFPFSKDKQMLKGELFSKKHFPQALSKGRRLQANDAGRARGEEAKFKYVAAVYISWANNNLPDNNSVRC